MSKKRHQAWSKKPYSKNNYKRDLSQEKSNIKNNFIDGLVQIVINDKAASNYNSMRYGYYPKIIK